MKRSASLAISTMILLIIALIVLISVIWFYYFVYSKTTQGTTTLTNEQKNQMDVLSLKMKCLNEDISRVYSEVEKEAGCSSGASVSCNQIIVEDNVPYYVCKVSCKSGKAFITKECEYNCNTHTASCSGENQ